MVSQNERIVLATMGEWHRDMLVIDSWINNRPKSQQAVSLLCAKLQECKDEIKERMEYLARKRGITADELWIQVLRGEAERLTAEEWANESGDEE
ncbi:hypothetical protein [Okeania sp. SIO2B9]|uniref:hypothetical protein n=1 Tax=Okeania sp. SIO2B9 TaxID=2607782 RepID=UPI0013BD5A1A|nr:hypothetical protein [Okeania sp. SIO2B9]NES71471.1 hypothetical protein [Okeania sp. SIO2D1]NES88603.1 hypothetical protein [Okeania sp. SIO2B9]